MDTKTDQMVLRANGNAEDGGPQFAVVTIERALMKEVARLEEVVKFNNLDTAIALWPVTWIGESRYTPGVPEHWVDHPSLISVSQDGMVAFMACDDNEMPFGSDPVDTDIIKKVAAGVRQDVSPGTSFLVPVDINGDQAVLMEEFLALINGAVKPDKARAPTVH